MSAAQAQIDAAVIRATAKKLIIIGYRPVNGLLTHPDGSLILTFDMTRGAVWDKIMAMAAAPKIEPAPLTSSRGVAPALESQGNLL